MTTLQDTAADYAVGSHRHSVRLGVRMGRWQTVLVLIMTAALIGAR